MDAGGEMNKNWGLRCVAWLWLFLIIEGYNFRPFVYRMLGPLDSLPNTISHAQRGDTLLLFIGTSKGLYSYSEATGKRFFLNVKGGVSSLSFRDSIGIFSSGNRLLLLDLNGHILIEKRVRDSISYVGWSEGGALALTGSILYSFDSKLRVRWKRKLPFRPDTLVVYYPLILLVGEGEILTLNQFGNHLWHWKADFEVTRLVYKWQENRLRPIPLDWDGRGFFAVFHAKGDSSLLVGITMKSGEEFLRLWIPRFVLSIEVVDSNIFLVSYQEREHWEGTVEKYTLDGSLVKKIETPSAFVSIKDVGGLLFLEGYFQSYSLLRYDLEEVWAEIMHEADAMYPYYSDKGDGYPDIVGLKRPVGDNLILLF
jgi:hypothetical protein